MKNNFIYNNILFNNTFKEHNQYLKNRLKKIKSTIYLNNTKQFIFPKDINKNKLNINDSKSKN